MPPAPRVAKPYSTRGNVCQIAMMVVGTDYSTTVAPLYARRYAPDASPSRGRCPNCTGTSATKHGRGYAQLENHVGQQSASAQFLLSKVLRTTKIRFGNVTPRIVNDSNSRGRVLFRGKVSYQTRMVSYLRVTSPAIPTTDANAPPCHFMACQCTYWRQCSAYAGLVEGVEFVCTRDGLVHVGFHGGREGLGCAV